MTPGQIVWLVRLGAGAVLALVVMGYMHGFLDLVRAPLEAQLDASRANQAAAKAGVERQNKSIDDARAASARRKEASAKAVEEAGKPALQRAEDIVAKPAPGDTPLARAANRINAEFQR